MSPLSCENIINVKEHLFDNAYHLPEDVLNYFFNQYILPLEDTLREYYDINIDGYEQPVVLEYENDGYSDGCDAFTYINQKWLKTKDRDLSYVLFLSEYQSSPNFDLDYEIYGGKVEFPQHNFGFNHQRGTLIVYPSTPHFIHHMNKITIGKAHIMRWYAKSSEPYSYDHSKFPGDYTTWFKDFV